MRIKVSDLRKVIREALESGSDDGSATFEKLRDMSLKNWDVIGPFRDVTKKYHIAEPFITGGIKMPGDYSEFTLSSRIDKLSSSLTILDGMAAAGLMLNADNDKFEKKIAELQKGYMGAGVTADKIERHVLPKFGTLVQFMKSYVARKRDEESTAVEEDEGAPLGRIAFAPERLDIKASEPNTSEEDSLLSAIKAYMAQANVKFPEKDADLMIDIFEKGLYQDMFKAPTEKYVFRAVEMTDEELKHVLEMGDNEELPEVGTRNGEFTVKNRKGKITSWTKDFQFARNWLRQGQQDFEKLEVIFYARSAKNPGKFIDVTGTYNVKNVNKYNMAEEVFGVGEITVDKVIWAPTWSGNYDFRKKTREKNKLPLDKWLYRK